MRIYDFGVVKIDVLDEGVVKSAAFCTIFLDNCFKLGALSNGSLNFISIGVVTDCELGAFKNLTGLFFFVELSMG